ncbi:hypothetical protein JW905_15010, partial [bacterium]|nr:hypothetical protein [candidate division CSSED10-310 bacterium]
DWMPVSRFLAPLVPLLAWGAGQALARLGHGRAGTVAAGVLAMLITVFQLLPGVPYWSDSPLLLHRQPDVLRELGLWLRANARPDAVIAVVPAGKIPFYSGLYTIDMRGLLDRHIARQPSSPGGLAGHEKRDPDYVLSRHPDYIITTGAVMKPAAQRDYEGAPVMVLDSYPILNRPEFRRWYRPHRIMMAEGEKDLMLYERIQE